jgi:hypothetical protein
MSSMFSPRAGKQATGVEGVRAYYLVVSAWPVPTYLDCKCSSCACCEYLSCDVIGRRGHPAQGRTRDTRTTPPRFPHRGVGPAPAPAGEPPFTMRKEGLHKDRVRPFILLCSQDKFHGIVPKRFRGSQVVAGRCARARV